ncbi:MAG: hypothetical protein A3K68_05545 [Euryarchaeota archaeon RBG_16_68_13]|nr:MAG: hypothetical protein A3K68_05545 [Euryarchaeota archaeon RBG_16_68_13]
MGLVLFVCVENTFRSVMAEAMFNAEAPRGWRAESAGVQAAEAVNPKAAELVREVGIDLGEKVPRTVTPAMVAAADRVVTFGCLDRCPIGAEAKGEDWSIPGSTARSPAELREIRDELRSRVRRLIDRIERGEITSRPGPSKP